MILAPIYTGFNFNRILGKTKEKVVLKKKKEKRGWKYGLGEYVTMHSSEHS